MRWRRARKVSPFCVARVLDIAPYADRSWIAGEFIEGGTLTQQISTQTPRLGADLQRLTVSIATALTTICRAGVVHHYFTPGNIMMAPDGPRAIDSGTARSLESLHGLLSHRQGRNAALHGLWAAHRCFFPSPLWMCSRGWGMVRHTFEGGVLAAAINEIPTGKSACSAVPAELRELVAERLAKAPGLHPGPHEVPNTPPGMYGDDTDIEEESAPTRLPMTGEPHLGNQEPI
ncbi:serine/threonine-protein kinase [Nocardiopsis protaetiae]|uniref:hypothetical protein n=1 Tax=Nocardiopsis protaetiae TaxID=3382270 RepID=UPI00387B15A8